MRLAERCLPHATQPLYLLRYCAIHGVTQAKLAPAIRAPRPNAPVLRARQRVLATCVHRFNGRIANIHDSLLPCVGTTLLSTLIGRVRLLPKPGDACGHIRVVRVPKTQLAPRVATKRKHGAVGHEYERKRRTAGERAHRATAHTSKSPHQRRRHGSVLTASRR